MPKRPYHAPENTGDGHKTSGVPKRSIMERLAAELKYWLVPLLLCGLVGLGILLLFFLITGVCYWYGDCWELGNWHYVP